ncbi:MAG: bifunctional shikimate kinase/3-dehydroquinate synthase [Thermoleophilia bacterium]|nr:bifunctional shikimate kinase/3-dehydroquinate synthase [Thermoleophilia bacterium]
MMQAAGRHIALIGFMGAGKTTVGAEVARLCARPFVDVDAQLEHHHGLTIPELFAERGELWFRNAESELTRELLDRHEPHVLALGGGGVTRPETREALLARAFTVLLEIEPDEAWLRVSRTSHRPLAADEDTFRALYDERLPVYLEAADAAARDADGVLLAAGDVIVERGALTRLDELVPGDGPVALVADERVLDLHRPALGQRLGDTHVVPSGEAAKRLSVCGRLWADLALDRSGTIVALGGGTTTDVAGFVAATYLRGVAWVAVPSSLVGQVDAAIGGKTGVDLAKGKNLVGAFHPPARVVADPALLATLPGRQRAEGMAEVVKTGLLANRELWRLPDEQLVRGCAAFKTSVCLADPLERGRRVILNLGHTFAHALEAAGRYREPTHGQAVALGLRAALSLSVRHLGLDPAVLTEVEELLPVERARVELGAAWEAMSRDKKALGGRIRLVLLEAPGKPAFPVELPSEEVRAALGALVAA